MPRAHREFIQEQGLPWLSVDLAEGLSPFDWKVLSQAEDGGAVTALARLEPGWRTADGLVFSAAQEFLVLEGELSVACGQRIYRLTPWAYMRIGAGAAHGPLSSATGCRLLWMTEGLLETVTPATDPLEPVTFTDPRTMEWELPWVKGPAPGLRLKLLWRNDETGAYSRLLSVDPGWSEPRLEHHDCSEEAFVLSGEMTLGALGTMRCGAYFWRPPGIKHGPMHSREGAVIFIRTDGALVNYYSTVDGTPLNY